MHALSHGGARGQFGNRERKRLDPLHEPHVAPTALLQPMPGDYPERCEGDLSVPGL